MLTSAMPGLLLRFTAIKLLKHLFLISLGFPALRWRKGAAAKMYQGYRPVSARSTCVDEPSNRPSKILLRAEEIVCQAG